MSGVREPIVKIGDVIEGRYRILRTLGEGGMGTVFLAEHTLIKRRVALKLLHPELATDAEVVERFMNEARAAGTLGHPNIVESTDMGFTPERVPYIVFEFLEGALLTDEIYRVGGLTVRRAVRIAQQIASALHAAHVANIIHRDLKSDNVFLTDKDESLDHVKVLDFGISRFLESEDKRTLRGIVMGTPEFMSPEQITAPDQVDRRTDVYALGVILYEMLTARRPFSSEEDPRALLTRIVQSPPPPLAREDVPHALGELILNKMLAKDPADRYPTMIDVEAALATYTTRAELGGLRRSRQATAPSIPAEVPRPGEAPRLAIRRPTLPRPVTTTAPPWHQGRPDTDDHIAAAAVAQAPPPRKPWLLYGVAGTGVVVGALGLFIGMRGASEPRPASAPIVIVPPPPPPAPAPAAGFVIEQAPRTVSQVDIRFEADAPGARVTFRRRVLEVPATFQINTSEIVELVEVAAPGFKTERYWLTFDRPTHLTARLVKGEGLVEATEEETLIALGELAAPAADPAASAAVAAVSPTTPGRRPARLPARRKIGRGPAKPAPIAPDPVVAAPLGPDGELVPQAEPADGPPPTTPSPEPGAPSPEPGSPELGKPSSEPGKTEPAKLELGKPDPGTDPSKDTGKPDGKESAKPVPGNPAGFAPSPSTKVPSTPPPPSASPSPSSKPLPSAPAVDDAAYAHAHRLDVDRCFAHGREVNPALAGSIRLELQITLDGRVKRVQPYATFDAPAVVDCIVKAAILWAFPVRTSGDVITVIAPYSLQ